MSYLDAATVTSALMGVAEFATAHAAMITTTVLTFISIYGIYAALVLI
jgi:hypothetical protein